MNVDGEDCIYSSSGKSSPPRSSSSKFLMYSPVDSSAAPVAPPDPTPSQVEPNNLTAPTPIVTPPVTKDNSASKHFDTRNSEHTRMNGKTCK